MVFNEKIKHIIIKFIKEKNKLPDQNDIPIDKTQVLSKKYILNEFNLLLAEFKSKMELYLHAVFDKNLRKIF